MQGETGDMFGINLCLHIASSLVLLESTAAALTKSLDRISNNPHFSGIDPTVVVTNAALYYLVGAIEANSNLKNDEWKAIEHVHNRFEVMAWMIGKPGMDALGIPFAISRAVEQTSYPLSPIPRSVEQTSYNVFLSHAGSNAWGAHQIAKDITHCGAVPFFDASNISAGQDLEAQILSALSQANELWVLLTPTVQPTRGGPPIPGALDRPYVWLEIGVAWFRNIPIIGLLQGITAADLQAYNDVPTLLKSMKLVDVNDIAEYDSLLEQLNSRAGKVGSEKSKTRAKGERKTLTPHQ